MAGDPRPLTARSVVGSTLLGVHPPRLPVAHLVRSGELFGIAEGTTRTALHRMVAAGELLADEGTYELAGRLLTRQARQDESRLGALRPWDGQWEIAVVDVDRRDAAERSALRDAMARLRLGELRSGVWLRPAVLDPDRLPEDRALVAAQCTTLLGTPQADPAALAARLWDLGAWAARAHELERALRAAQPALEDGDLTALAPGFLLGAEVLRHFQVDPLLPAELLPRDWPGATLRHTYEVFDATFKAAWRAGARAPA